MYFFFLDIGVFSWLLKKQQSIAQSSYEVEYISSSIATSQAICMA